MVASYVDTTSEEPFGFDEREFRARVLLAEQLNYDVVVICSPASVRYFSGTSFLTMRTIPERLGAVVLARGHEPLFVHCSLEYEHAKQEAWLSRGLSYTEFEDHPISVIADHLRAMGASRARIGIEGRYLPGGDVDRLRRELPESEIEYLDGDVERLRALKSPTEQRLLVDYATLTDQAIAAAFEQAHVGMTERHLGEIMVREALSRGAEEKLFQTMVSGTNGFKAHAAGSDRPLAVGDVVRTDFGMVWPGGYLSDVAHVAFVGEPSAAQRDTYSRLEEVHQQLAVRMSEGTPASLVFNTAVRLMEGQGLDFFAPHVGHSIGLVLHENPMMHPHDHTVLQTGMVFMLEPIVRAADGLYHVEDLVVVGAESGRIASRSRDWSTPFVIAS